MTLPKDNRVRLTISTHELQSLRALIFRLNQAIAYNSLIEAEDLTSDQFEAETYSVTKALERNGYSPLELSNINDRTT